MDKKVEESIEELQVLEQNMQQMLMQKQMLQNQLVEIDSALEELKKNPKQVFKVAGAVMIESSKVDVEKEFKSKKEMVDVKLKNIDKQEEKLKEKVKEVQSFVLGNMKKNE